MEWVDLIPQIGVPVLVTLFGAIIVKWQNAKQDRVSLMKSKEEVRMTTASALEAMQNSYDKFVEDAQKQYDRLQEEIRRLNKELLQLNQRERESIKQQAVQAEQIRRLREQRVGDQKLIVQLTRKVEDYQSQKMESDRKIAALEMELKTYHTRD